MRDLPFGKSLVLFFRQTVKIDEAANLRVRLMLSKKTTKLGRNRLTQKTWNDIISPIKLGLWRTLMNKEDILKAAQNSKGKCNEYENKENLRSGLFGSLIALVVGAVVFFVEYFCFKRVDCGLLAVAFSGAGADNFLAGIRTKRAGSIIAGSVELLVALFLIVAFVCQVVSA